MRYSVEKCDLALCFQKTRQLTFLAIFFKCLRLNALKSWNTVCQTCELNYSEVSKFHKSDLKSFLKMPHH